jgi:hypothetical protein
MARSGVPDPLITVTWNAKGAATEIKTARSLDGGRTFVQEKALQAKGAPGDRGWQASAADARGALHTVWLDHRAMAASKATGDHSEHKGEHDGVAMAQKSGLYYAADGQPERELFKGVCYCCKTALAIGPGGEIFAALAPRVPRQHARHGIHDVARRRQDLYAARAREPRTVGRSRAVQTTARRWRSMPRARCTWSGRR